ncbi:ras and EF-hand domain-containing protein isoform X2 [Gouania willdenowi]|uniref:ras and EF-hand domain-containing protein isoform X2 n=1 Tax=Gouania willdenowi TaxID=441366 RepID=UPI001054C246|nr:ras and EF-hand domain-containing protein isoform X2 [Gouania willdenowi]
MSSEEQDRLRSLFLTYDVDGSGVVERTEFLIICTELQVSEVEAQRIFDRLDVDRDGTVTLQEFISGFHLRYGEDVMEDGNVSVAWEQFKERMGEQARFIPRHELAATLYQNISLTEPRLIPQFEKVVITFTKEIKQQNSEMENLALAIKRAQDQASMQLSEMEEEMDQRIHCAERKTREQEKRRMEAALNELRRGFENEICELQCKIQKMQMIEEKYKSIAVKDESPALRKKINELTLENQRVKQELMRSQTKVACLQSEMDSLKTELTDQSINWEHDEELIKQFTDERDALENQIEILQTANRKLHDTNDSLRATMERLTRSGTSGSSGEMRDRSKSICYSSTFSLLDKFRQRADEFPAYGRRPSCDTLALAMCDPGLRRRDSSECEEDSMPELYMDSGLSTLRGSHGGYDSEPEVKGHEEDDTEEEEEKVGEDVTDRRMRESSDTEAVESETQDKESAFGSDSSSMLDWRGSEPTSISRTPAPRIRKALSAINVQDDPDAEDLGYMTSEKAYRIVLAGDAAVGKSSFLLRLCKNEFSLNSSATLGVDFHMKTFIVDGDPILLQLWDTAGQERFRSIAKSYFRRADGVLLLYDVTCEQSFLNVRDWVDTIEQRT